MCRLAVRKHKSTPNPPGNFASTFPNHTRLSNFPSTFSNLPPQPFCGALGMGAMNKLCSAAGLMAEIVYSGDIQSIRTAH